MKRAAAIIGPTSSFVRWAVRHECPFRQIDCDNLPFDTFRQLRSIRELSAGFQADRVVNGFCIHPHHNTDPQTARGFPTDEVYDLYGDRELIEQTCGPCHANAVHVLSDNQDAWAGCYGWFFATNNESNWIEDFGNVTASQHPEFGQTNKIWFAVWQNEHWNSNSLQPLQVLLEAVLAQKTQRSPKIAPEFIRFCDAVNRCIEHDLELHTELIPAGHSDGVTWTIESCCSNCHCELKLNSKICKEMICEECGYVGLPSPQQKRKVLGLRPYMLLRDLIGESQTQRLLDAFHAQK